MLHPLWGAIVGLKGQHTLKCFESSLPLAAASLEKGLSTQRAWAWTARGSVLLKVTAASLLLPCLGRHGGVPFPEPSSASSPSVPHRQQSWEWVPVLAFGGICSLGSYLHWCWSPRFLAMTMTENSLLLPSDTSSCWSFFSLYPCTDLNSLHPPQSTWHLEGRDNWIEDAKA